MLLFRAFLEIVDPIFVKDYNSYDLGQSRADVMKFYIMYYFGGEYSNMLIINYLSKISVDDKTYN